MKNLFLYILIGITLSISGCATPQETKILVTDTTNTCISESKEECERIVKTKCDGKVKIFREELVEYVFESNKYFLTFRCE